MSAYIVDPRTIDYLVTWVRTRTRTGMRAYLSEGCSVPAELQYATDGNHLLLLSHLTADELGTVLLRENVRSVQYRYGGPVEELPGPIDQSRVLNYHFVPVPPDVLHPAWVINSCDCLDYQSCETSDYKESIAHAILQSIRESAIGEITRDAPWGVTERDLSVVGGDS